MMEHQGMYKLTGQEEAGERHHVELLHGDVIAVHEEVQQVDGEVASCRTQPETVADDGNEVCEVPPEAELRGLSFEGRQLELLFDSKVHCHLPTHTWVDK